MNKATHKQTIVPKPSIAMVGDKTGHSNHQPLSTNHQIHPQFFGKVNPDTYLVGFDLTAEEAMSHGDPIETDTGYEAGWFFALQERPGDIRFGADVPESDTGLNQTPPDSNIDVGLWKDLNWGHIADAMEIDKLSDLSFIDLSQIDGNINSLENPTWDKPSDNNSANLASIFYQPHKRVAIHADQMIK